MRSHVTGVLFALALISACSVEDEPSDLTQPEAAGSDAAGSAARPSTSGGSRSEMPPDVAMAPAASSMGASGTGAGASGAGASGASVSGAGGSGGASTSGAGGMTGAAGSTLPVGDCIGDWQAGTYPADFITGGGTSSLPPIGGYDYAVHVPAGYDCHLPTPILYGLHGLGMSGYSFNVGGTSTPDRTGGLVAKADEEGFILVMTTGLGPTDDAVQTIRDIFEELESHLNIDHGRVYATGHSFGGALSFRLACVAADLFTAVAPNAWTTAPAPCTPAQPIAVLASRGTEDAIAPPGDLGATMGTLAAANGCAAMETPATVPASGADTTCLTHADCDGGVEVTTCTIMGGGHTWFGDPTCGTGADACAIVGANSDYYVNTDFAWDFLKRFSR